MRLRRVLLIRDFVRMLLTPVLKSQRYGMVLNHRMTTMVLIGVSTQLCITIFIRRVLYL